MELGLGFSKEAQESLLRIHTEWMATLPPNWGWPVCSSENYWHLRIFVSSALLNKTVPCTSSETVAQSPVLACVAFLLLLLALSPRPLLIPATWDIRSHPISFPKLFPVIWGAPVGPSKQFTYFFHFKQSPDLSGLLGFPLLTHHTLYICLSHFFHVIL